MLEAWSDHALSDLSPSLLSVTNSATEDAHADGGTTADDGKEGGGHQDHCGH